MQRNDISKMKMQPRVQMVRIVLITEDIFRRVGYIRDCSRLCIMIKITLRLTLYKFITFEINFYILFAYILSKSVCIYYDIFYV